MGNGGPAGFGKSCRAYTARGMNMCIYIYIRIYTYRSIRQANLELPSVQAELPGHRPFQQRVMLRPVGRRPSSTPSQREPKSCSISASAGPTFESLPYRSLQTPKHAALRTGDSSDLLCTGGLLDLVRGSLTCSTEEELGNQHSAIAMAYHQISAYKKHSNWNPVCLMHLLFLFGYFFCCCLCCLELVVFPIGTPYTLSPKLQPTPETLNPGIPKP